jgi:hypothetical protein
MLQIFSGRDAVYLEKCLQDGSNDIIAQENVSRYCFSARDGFRAGPSIFR